MSRQHFERMAWNLRIAYPEPTATGAAGDLASDFYAGRVRGWESAVMATAHACAASNGRFDYGRFYRAAGFERRPDGSMYPMRAPAR